MSFCALKWSYVSPAVLNGGLTRSDLAVLRRSGSLASCRAALDRVRQTSRNGRKIGNRVGYLLTALHTGETPHGKTDSA